MEINANIRHIHSWLSNVTEKSPNTSYITASFDYCMMCLMQWVYALSVSVEIELKMDWQGCKKVIYFQILHLIGQWD